MSEDPDELTPDEAFAELMRTNVGLKEVDVSKPRPWTRGMPGYMRPGRALWAGRRGEGKTDAALTAAVDVVAAGGVVVWLDLDRNGRLRIAERLDCILKSRPGVDIYSDHGFEYFEGFDFTALDSPVVMKELKTFLGDVDLLVIDSLPRALADLGLNENEPSHVLGFVTKYVDPLVGEGCSVLALDNTGHSVRSRPRGASSKEDVFELCYLVTGGQTCFKDRHGEIHLKRSRHRDGDEFTNLSLGFGGGDYGSIVADDSVAKLLDEVLRIVPTPQSKNWIFAQAKAAGIKVGRKRLFDAMNEWVLDPESGFIETLDGKFGPTDD
jgi:hypothetical protein